MDSLWREGKQDRLGGGGERMSCKAGSEWGITQRTREQYAEEAVNEEGDWDSERVGKNEVEEGGIQKRRKNADGGRELVENEGWKKKQASEEKNEGARGREREIYALEMSICSAVPKTSEQSVTQTPLSSSHRQCFYSEYLATFVIQCLTNTCIIQCLKEGTAFYVFMYSGLYYWVNKIWWSGSELKNKDCVFALLISSRCLLSSDGWPRLPPQSSRLLQPF